MVRPGNTRLRRSQNMTIESNKFNNSSSIGRPIAIQNFFKRRSVENCIVNSVWKRVLVGDMELLDNGLELNIPGIDIGFGTGFNDKGVQDSTFNKKLPQLNTPTQAVEKNVFFYPYPVAKNADDEIQNQNLENMLVSFWNRLHQNNESMNAMIALDDTGVGINDFYKKAIQAGIDNYESQFSNGGDTEVDRNGVRLYNWMQKELYNFVWKTAFVDMVNDTIKQQKVDEKDKIYLKTSDVVLKNYSKDIFTEQNGQRPTNIFYTSASFKLDIPVRILEDDNLKFLNLWKDDNTIKTNVNSHLKNSVHQQILDPFYKIIKSVNNRLLYRGWANSDWNQRMFNIVYEMFHNTNVGNPTDAATATFSELGNKYRKDFSDYIKNVDNVGLSRPSIPFNDVGFNKQNAPTVPNSDTGVFNTTNMDNNIIANTTDDTIKAELQNALDIVFREHYLKKVFDTNFTVANDPASQKVKINTDVGHNVYVWPLYLMLENKGRVYRVNRNVYIEKAKELDLNRMFGYTHSPVILNTKTKFQRSKQDVIVQIIAARRSRSIDFKKKKVQESIKLMSFEKRFENYINPVRGEGTLEQPVIFEISEDGMFEYYFYRTIDEDVEDENNVDGKIQVRLSNDIITKFNNITLANDRKRISDKAKEIANMINLYDLNGNEVNEFENKYDFDESGLISDIQVLYEALNYDIEPDEEDEEDFVPPLLILNPDGTIREDSVIFENAVKTIEQNIGSIFSDTVYSVSSKNDKEDELKLDIVKTGDRFDVYLKTNSSENKEIKLKHLEVHLAFTMLARLQHHISKFNNSTFKLDGEDVPFSNSPDIFEIMSQLIEVSKEFDDTYEIDEFGTFKLTFFEEKTIKNDSLLFSIDTHPSKSIDIPFLDDDKQPIIANVIDEDYPDYPVLDQDGIPVETEQAYSIYNYDLVSSNWGNVTFNEKETYFVFSTEYDGVKHYNFSAFDDFNQQPEAIRLNTFYFENKYNQQTTDFNDTMVNKIIKLVQKFEFANFSKIESIDEEGEINYETKPIVNKYDFQRALIFDEDDLKKYNIYKRNRMEVLLFIMMVELYTDYKMSSNTKVGDGQTILENAKFDINKQEFSIKIKHLELADEIKISPDDNLKNNYSWREYEGGGGDTYKQSTILTLNNGTLGSLNEQKLSGQVVISHNKNTGNRDYTYPSSEKKYTFYTDFYNYIKNAAEEFKKVETMFLNVIRSPQNKIRDIQILNNSVDKFKKNMEEAVEIISDSTYYVDDNSDDQALEYPNKITPSTSSVVSIISGVPILQRMYQIHFLIENNPAISYFNDLLNYKTTIDTLFTDIPYKLIRNITKNEIKLSESYINIKTVYETQMKALKEAGVYEEPEVKDVVSNAYITTNDFVYIENVEPFGFYYDIGDNNKETLKKFKENKKLVDDRLKELAEKEMTPKTEEILKGKSDEASFNLYSQPSLSENSINNLKNNMILIQSLVKIDQFFKQHNYLTFNIDFNIKTLIKERTRLDAVLKRTVLKNLTTNYTTLKNNAEIEIKTINDIIVIYYYYKMAVLTEKLSDDEKKELNNSIKDETHTTADEAIIKTALTKILDEADKANSSESKKLEKELNEMIKDLEETFTFDTLNNSWFQFTRVTNTINIENNENSGSGRNAFNEKMNEFKGSDETKKELTKKFEATMNEINKLFTKKLTDVVKPDIEKNFYTKVEKNADFAPTSSTFSRDVNKYIEEYKIMTEKVMNFVEGSLRNDLKIENILTDVFQKEYDKLTKSNVGTNIFNELKVLYANVFGEAKNKNFDIFKCFNDNSSTTQKGNLKSFFGGAGKIISDLKTWRNKINMITALKLSDSVKINTDLKKLYDVRLVQQLFEFNKDLDKEISGQPSDSGRGFVINKIGYTIPDIINPYHTGQHDVIIKTTHDILKNKFDLLNLYALPSSDVETVETLGRKYRELRKGINYVYPLNKESKTYFGDMVNKGSNFTIHDLQENYIYNQIDRDKKKASEKALEKIKKTELFISNLNQLRTADNLDAIYNSVRKWRIKFQYGKIIKEYDVDPNDTPSKTIEDYDEDKTTINNDITQFKKQLEAVKKAINKMKEYKFNEIQNGPWIEYTKQHKSFITSSTGFSSQQKLIYEIRDLDFDADGKKDKEFKKDDTLLQMENRLDSYSGMIVKIETAFFDKYDNAIKEIKKKEEEQEAAEKKLNETIKLQLNFTPKNKYNWSVGVPSNSQRKSKLDNLDFPSYDEDKTAWVKGDEDNLKIFQKSKFKRNKLIMTDFDEIGNLSKDWVEFKIENVEGGPSGQRVFKIKISGLDDSRRSGIDNLYIGFNDGLKQFTDVNDKISIDTNKKLIHFKKNTLYSSFYGTAASYENNKFDGEIELFKFEMAGVEYKGIKAHFKKIGVESGGKDIIYSTWWDQPQGRLYNLRVSSVKPTIVNESDEKIRGFDIPEHLMKSRGVVEDLDSILGDFDGDSVSYTEVDNNILWDAMQTEKDNNEYADITSDEGMGMYGKNNNWIAIENYYGEKTNYEEQDIILTRYMVGNEIAKQGDTFKLKIHPWCKYGQRLYKALANIKPAGPEWEQINGLTFTIPDQEKSVYFVLQRDNNSEDQQNKNHRIIITTGSGLEIPNDIVEGGPKFYGANIHFTRPIQNLVWKDSLNKDNDVVIKDSKSDDTKNNIAFLKYTSDKGYDYTGVLCEFNTSKPDIRLNANDSILTFMRGDTVEKVPKETSQASSREKFSRLRPLGFNVEKKIDNNRVKLVAVDHKRAAVILENVKELTSFEINILDRNNNLNVSSCSLTGDKLSDLEAVKRIYNNSDMVDPELLPTTSILKENVEHGNGMGFRILATSLDEKHSFSNCIFCGIIRVENDDETVLPAIDNLNIDATML